MSSLFIASVVALVLTALFVGGWMFAIIRAVNEYECDISDAWEKIATTSYKLSIFCAVASCLFVIFGLVFA